MLSIYKLMTSLQDTVSQIIVSRNPNKKITFKHLSTDSKTHILILREPHALHHRETSEPQIIRLVQTNKRFIFPISRSAPVSSSKPPDQVSMQTREVSVTRNYITPSKPPTPLKWMSHCVQLLLFKNDSCHQIQTKDIYMSLQPIINDGCHSFALWVVLRYFREEICLCGSFN